MTTNQTEARRLNALKSTGPQTPEGKRKAAKNATRHGLRASEVLIGLEQKADLDALANSFVLALSPVGAIEEQIVERMALAAWRLRRATRLEMSLFAREWENRVNWANKYPKDDATSDNADVGKDLLGLAEYLPILGRYETTHERAFYRGLHELQRLQAARLGQPVSLPAVIDVDVETSGSFGKNE